MGEFGIKPILEYRGGPEVIMVFLRSLTVQFLGLQADRRDCFWLQRRWLRRPASDPDKFPLCFHRCRSMIGTVLRYEVGPSRVPGDDAYLPQQ